MQATADNVEDLPDEGILTLGNATSEFLLIKAVPGTFVRKGLAFGVAGTGVKIEKIAGDKCQREPAFVEIVRDEKQAIFDFMENRFVAVDPQRAIGQKLTARFPDRPAAAARLEGSHNHSQADHRFLSPPPD